MPAQPQVAEPKTSGDTTTPSTSQAIDSQPSQSSNPDAAPIVSSISSSTSPTASGTNQATSSNAQTAAKANASKGHSSGELAGGVIGAAIGAALIAILLTWLLMRRQRRRRNYSSRHRSRSYDTKGDVVVTEKSLSSNSKQPYSWQAHLPQSTDDQTIQTVVKTLFDQVDLHVDNFYKQQDPQVDDIDREALARVDPGELPMAIEELLQDERLSSHVIKHCIAANLIKRITPALQSAHSLLPAHLSLIPAKASSAEAREISPQVYSQWRQLTAYLCPQPEKDPVFVQERNTSAAYISDMLDAAFSPWRSSEIDLNTFRQHERSLVFAASNAGILLMTQPSAFRFRWNPPGEDAGNAASRALVVYPGFWKTTGEDGVSLHKPQRLLAPVTVRT